MSLVSAIDSPLFKPLGFVRQALFNPILTGSFLVILAKGPDVARNYLLELIQRSSLTPDVVKNGLCVLFGLGLVKTVNATLSELASNSYRISAAPGWDWSREVAVVTGGCSGIGFCIVERLLLKGIKVAVLDIQDLPKSLQGRVRYYKCDVTSAESVAQAANAVRRDLGHPSILINNAGITKPSTILEMSDEFLHKIFGVNTISHWTLCKQFVPAMVEKNKGHIVTVASVASFVALPGGADYSATKASALAFHEGLAAELKVIHKAPNVLTTVVHPNFVSTPLIADFKHVLVKGGVRFLTPERVADEVVAQIFRRKGGQLIIPKSSGTISALRGWPTWLQVLIRDGIARGTANHA